ncbi:hypothetical protein CK203_009581 [Vitis vinifera]|uniref:Uncharacterized protein n=1 Tax=Vitis vinifera TaxID=29760 RepID=A0A438JSC6_VITVI|nr:hypothetical protein CK203_009581 [Vitis vinifera]
MEDIVEIVLANTDIKKEMEMLQLVRHAGADSAYENAACAMSSWWRSHGILLRTFYVLFLGQVVSFVLAVASFSSSFIADLGVDAPLTQSFFTYLSLALVYGSILLYRRQKLRVNDLSH